MLVVHNYSRNGSITINAKTLLLVFVVFFNSEILNGLGSNPMGIKGVQEIFYSFLLVFSIVYVVSRVRPIHDILVLFLTFLLLLLSAVAAAIKFGQPIWFGLFENRKVLAVLVYFPLVHILRSNQVSYRLLEQAIVNMAIACAVLSVGIYLGIMPTINGVEEKVGASREIRFAIGQVFIAISIVLLLAPSAKGTHRFRLQKAVILAFVLLFIIQTRQLILITLLGLLFVGGSGRLLILLGSAFVIISLAFGSILSIFNDFYGLFASALTSEYISDSWRAQSVATIIYELRQGIGLGNGGLYVGWQDGFHRVYGPFFYLADVGIFGSLYRYGLLFFPIYGVYVALQVSILKRIQDYNYKRLFIVLFLMLLIASPVAAPLEVRGQVAGFILAASAYFAGIGRRPKTDYQIENYKKLR